MSKKEEDVDDRVEERQKMERNLVHQRGLDLLPPVGKPQRNRN